MIGKAGQQIVVALVLTSAGFVKPAITQVQKFDNDYLTIDVALGWKVEDIEEQVVTFRHGKYLLEINPVFLHASPIEGGRFDEVVDGNNSINAVMANVDRPAGGIECSESHSKPTVVTRDITLGNFYTDKTKAGNGCVFPRSDHSVWFGSITSGRAAESDFFIRVTYDTIDVDQLPEKGSPALQKALADVVRMLKTLRMKKPIEISRIEPLTASPGETVTIYGRGFHVFKRNVEVRFDEFPNNPLPAPNIAPDGESLTFLVPTSVNKISCPTGKIDVNESCVPTPPNHVDLNDCPETLRRATTFCGIPILPDRYHISVGENELSSNSVMLRVSEHAPRAVEISLLYPNSNVLQDDEIVIRGSGFTSTGNTVEIGSAKVTDLASPDGHTITFRAPEPMGDSFVRGWRAYEASVSNANGTSNSITFQYQWR